MSPPLDCILVNLQYNKYKLHIISSKIPDGTSTTVYRCGPMIDLCVGPHIPHTGRIKAMSILKVRFLFLQMSTVWLESTSEQLLLCLWFAELCFILPGRPKERFSPTSIWNLVPRWKADDRIQAISIRSRQKRSPKDRKRARIIPLPRNVSGFLLLAASWN